MKPSKGQDPGQLLAFGAKNLNVELDREGLQRLVFYFDELLRWSRKINLIGKKQSNQQIIENHFLDSLILLNYLKKGSTLLDVGTGGGFPGLICKAANPDLELILVEPRQKRCSFLRHITRSLKLDRVRVYDKRIEEVEQQSLVCTHITSRAVAELKDFLTMVAPLVSSEVRLLCMKGPKWKDELKKAEDVVEKLGIELTKTDEFELPFTHARRAILCFQKRQVVGE